MRIAVFHNLPRGGAKRLVFEHTRRLNEQGHVLDAYTTDASAETDFLPLAPLCENVYRYPAPSAAADPPRLPGPAGKLLFHQLRLSRQRKAMDNWERLYTQMAADIIRRGYDVVYAHNCLHLQSPFLLRALRGAIPTLFYCHDTLRSAHEWAIATEPGYATASGKALWGRRRFQGRLLPAAAVQLIEEQAWRDWQNARAATAVVVNSCYSREAMLRCYGIEAQVLGAGVDTEFYAPAHVERTRNVFAVGAIAQHKRYDFLIDAVGTIPLAERPPLCVSGYDLNASGDAESPLLSALRRRAAAQNVTLHVEREVSDEKIRAAYQSAGVVAFAPHLEPLGLVALEAMACGAPVVGVAEGGVRETIQSGKNGVLTARDPEEFGRALLQILNDPAAAAALGRGAREFVCEAWNWEHSAKRLERLLHLLETVGAA